MTQRVLKPAQLTGLRPIELPGFTLTHTGVEVVGRPTFAQFEGAWSLATRANQASGWWIAGLMAVADRRPDWQDRIDHLIDSGVITARTRDQYAYIEKAVPVSSRLENVSFAHHAEVASIAPQEQKGWLEKSRDEGWSVRDLRLHLRAAKRPKVLDGQAKLEGMFRIIYADPPWKYQERTPMLDGSHTTVEDHYATLTMEQICALPVAAHALPDAMLFLWVTAPMLYETPGPREVIAAWGFEPKSSLCWDKVNGMPGHYGLQVCHELLIIASRGSCPPDVPTPHDDSVLVSRRQGEHSEKPEAARQYIDRHWTQGPKVELFARKQTEGWQAYGNDMRLAFAP